MRAVDILRTAIGNSFRSRLRTTLTVIAIFIGAFTLTITNGLGTGINNYIDGQLSAIGAPDVMTVTKPAEATTATGGPPKYDPQAGSAVAAEGPPGTPSVVAMTDADLSAIAAVPGIVSVEPVENVRTDYVQWADHDKYVLATSPLGQGVQIQLAAGAQFDQSSDQYQIILPTSYVEPMGFADYASAIGQTVSIAVTDALGQQHVVEATIVGIQDESLFGASASLGAALTTELYDLQSTGLPAATTTEYSSATARFDTAVPVAQVKSALQDAGYSGSTVADRIGAFQTVVDGIILVLNAFAIIALLAAGFGIINTLLMSVQERTREIGLMKAMGMSGARIFALFSTEAVFIGFLGSAIGAAIAMIAGGLVSGVLANGFLAGLPGLQLLAFTPLSIGAVLLLVMGIAFVAAVLPASRAARQSPIDSLRYE